MAEDSKPALGKVVQIDAQRIQDVQCQVITYTVRPAISIHYTGWGSPL